MNEKIIFVRTNSGEDEVRSRTAHLSKDIKRALLMVDGTATVAEIMKRSAPSLRAMLEDMFTELARGGYIQDKAKAGRVPKPSAPLDASPDKPANEMDALDFTAAYRAPTPAMLAEERDKLAARAIAVSLVEEQKKADTDIAGKEAERLAAGAQAARVLAEQEAQARVRAETERRASDAVEAARKAEHYAAQIKAEVEARAADERARLEAEVLQLKAQAESEARARARVEEQARLDVEAARAQAEQLAREAVQAARVKAEQDAARAESDVRAQAERNARAAADEAHKAEQHAAEVRAETEARAAAEERARLEAEVQRLKAQADGEARSRAKAKEQARLAAEHAEQLARDAAARIKAEHEAAQREAQARVSAEAERHAREVAETIRQAEQQAAQIKAEAEALARAAEEERAKLAVEVSKLKSQAEAEASARSRAAELAKLEAERQAQEAQAVRLKAEQEAARAREEMEQERARAATETQARIDAERVAREAEAARVQAEQQAASIKAEAQAHAEQERRKAEAAQAELAAARARDEQEAARVKAEAAELVNAQQEEARRKIAQAATKVREAAERAKQVAEARANEEALRAEQAAEAARVEQAAVMYQMNAELGMQRRESDVQSNSAMLAAIVRLNAKHAAMEESVFSALDSQAQQEADELAENASQHELPAASGDSAITSNLVAEKRTTIAAVAFFDVANYSSQSISQQVELKRQLNQLVTLSLAPLGAGERVILDMGEGVAIGFLQHPTDALETAMHFRSGLMANKHYDYPDLRVRIGIHLGPVSLVKDMNGRINMLGDGINSAQRVMVFAGNDQIYVSRAYFDFVSSLSDEYGNLFRYRGSQQDKQGRELQVYELLDAEGPAEEVVQIQSHDAPAEPADKLDDFNFEAFDAALSQPSEHAAPLPLQTEAASQLLKDAVGLVEMGVVESVVVPVLPVAQVEESRKGQVKEQVTESQYSDAEARQLADVQAKKWQEAELRAAEQARKKAESVPPVKSPVAAIPVAVVPRRKPLSWGKLAAGVAAVAIVALFVVPLLLPTQGYRTSMEQMLGAKLQQPVHIGQLTGRVLPTPRLVLSEVSIGQTRQIQSKQVQLNFAFAALFGKVKPIENIELTGLQISAAALPQVASWLQLLAADQQYPVARMALTQGLLAADGLQFADVDGELNFDASGKFSQASLNAGGHKIGLTIQAMPEHKMRLSIALHDSTLPLLPNWNFDELKANGELTQDGLHLTDFDARILGGVLSGEASIDWRNGWRAQGALVAKVIPLQNINKLLSGDLDGTARFQMQAENLVRLTDTAVLNGVFSAKKGMISGMDIVETARLRSREVLPGGRTHFEELSGELLYANNSFQFRQLKMNDSVVKATGALTVNKQQLSGNVSAELTMRAGMGAVALQIGGTAASPVLRAVH